jgi:hypothetical protein
MLPEPQQGLVVGAANGLDVYSQKLCDLGRVAFFIVEEWPRRASR